MKTSRDPISNPKIEKENEFLCKTSCQIYNFYKEFHNTFNKIINSKIYIQSHVISQNYQSHIIFQIETIKKHHLCNIYISKEYLYATS